MAHGSSIGYEWQHGALLRASTAAGAIPLPDLDLYGDDAATQGRAWLATVWCDQVPDALAAASPILFQQVAAILDGKHTDARRVRRAVLSLASYLLRWNHRATPFGVFAGVVPAQVGRATRVAWSDKQRTVLRADADWLTDVVTRLEQSPGLLARLDVVANNAGQRRGDRHVVPGLPSDAHTRLLAPVELSIRRTRPVAAALTAAATPLPFSSLLRGLAELFPAARPEQLSSLLAGLLSKHILISSLWPPMTCTDTLTYVCDQLEKADAASIRDIADLASRLGSIRDGVNHPDTAAPWAPGAPLTRSMQDVSATARVPLLVDTVLDCDVQIPEHLVREAAEAATVMYRLTPHPYGYPQWRDYHQRFRARYGAGAMVPVLDLVADSGLGLPADYLGADRTRAPRQLVERDETILTLLQQAMLDDNPEIVLTKATVSELAAGDAELFVPVPRAEVSMEIHAASLDAIQHSDYRLLITGAPRPGSSMLGRFAHLLPPQAQSALASSYATAGPGAIPAQLSFPPRRRRNENVTRAMRLLPHVIPLGEHHAPGPGVIPLADLAVTADARQFYLVQMSSGRRIEPRVPHALEASVHTPPLARFLAEITTSRCAVYKAFNFGAAARLPYLPRVRYKRTVLAPARWLLAAEDLPGRGVPMPDWETALHRWRDRFRVPDRVALVEYDQQLPIDLSQRLHRAVLRARLDSTRRIELRETPGPEDRAWIGRPHELLIPLKPANAAGLRSGPPAFTVPAATTRALMPGRASILHAQLHAHPQRFGEILTGHLPGLLAQFTDPPRWWFRRHRDTTRPDSDQHLALYLHLPAPDDYGAVSATLHDWADALHDQRLASRLELVTYRPQTGRYGHGPALDAAHAVFAADSAACLAQIRITSDDSHTGHALTAASMYDLVTRFTGDADQAADWLTRHLPREHGPLDRALLRQTLALTHPDGAALRSTPGGPDVAAAWQERASALHMYREQLARQRDPHTVLMSLIHQHYIRTLPVDTDRERLIGRLVRACALRHRESRP
ncbi:lantibiotic dehydratase [Streptomyces sp. NPDC050804]|uniref:lantibiotic dehydratase n=1 Tax=unclassified Streptomyces TaxID=2593676 RepID=UPI003444CCB2|nr:lantibiotic dehydratase [Streptomyces sp. NBC_00872]